MSANASYYFYILPENLDEFLGLWSYCEGDFPYGHSGNAQQIVAELRTEPGGLPYRPRNHAEIDKIAGATGDGFFIKAELVEDEDESVRSYLGLPPFPNLSRQPWWSLRRQEQPIKQKIQPPSRYEISPIDMDIHVDHASLRWEPGQPEYICVELEAHGRSISSLFRSKAFTDFVIEKGWQSNLPAIFHEDDCLYKVILLDGPVEIAYIPHLFAFPERLREILPALRFPVQPNSWKSENPVERAAALLQAEDPVAVRKLRDWYQDEDVLVRRVAIGVLDAPLETLRDPSPRVRQLACEGLEWDGLWDFYYSLGKILQDLLDDGDPGVRIAAAVSLYQNGDCDREQMFSKLSQDSSPEVRMAAIVLQAGRVW